MKQTIKHITRAIAFWAIASTSYAGILTMRFGPPGLGTGGTNPVSIPPSGGDIDIGYVSQSKWETTLSVFPGIFVGKRIDFSGPYVSLGGGVVISGYGQGIGPYSAFGYDFGKGPLRINLEYKQALGISTSGIIQPYAVRLGVAWY